MRALLGRTNKDWWPEMLATEVLNPNGPSNPYGDDFDYAEAFNALDYSALKQDLKALTDQTYTAAVYRNARAPMNRPRRSRRCACWKAVRKAR